MRIKKILSFILVLTLMLSIPVFASAADTQPEAIAAATDTGLYAHGVLSTDTANSQETQAWQKWQWNESKNRYYFYLPSGADDEQVELLNNSGFTVQVGESSISPQEIAVFSYETGKIYRVHFQDETFNLEFMKSNAESAIYLNNANADGNGTGLWDYLSQDKDFSAEAEGAIVDADGNVDNTSVKKIKGRGNSTWDKDKKPFNITYTDRVSIGGMEAGKKYSLLANYQDASLARNRFLYDLSDAVGMPYASDSRFVDFYVDGEYKGAYQMCQKIDTGKGSLLADIDEEQYLSEDGSLAENFNFVCEVDASAGSGDYYITSESGNNLTMKTPELEEGDPLYNALLRNVKEKFDSMFTAIKNKVDNLNDYVDVDSLTKIYLINELGKNWDSGVSSLYFTYKQDTDGTWKFFASPVWDYDNSLGNATGVEGELQNMGVTDYEEPTGWWCKFKGARKGAKSSSNIMFNIARNTTVLEAAPQIWFEEFLPVLERFASKNVFGGEMYSSDVYYNLLKDSADMNYTSGWLLNTGSWICDHSSLNLCHYDKAANTYSQDTAATKYDTNTFKGEYDYTVDWLMSRAAWLSAQMYEDYTPSFILGDVNLDGKLDIRDATEVQLYIAGAANFSNRACAAADVNKDSQISILDATEIQLLVASLS